MMNHNPFLSVIIPIYNGEHYILKCLNSIWEQNILYEDIEVICVNDCSNDETEKIILEEQKKHPNLKLFTNKENLKAGGSRNRGMKEANGKYVLFIDCDDYFHSASLEKAVNYQKKNDLDILMCDFAREYEPEISYEIVHNYSNRKILTGDNFLLANGIPYGPCKFIFKKELVINNNVYFEEKVCCEDVDWTHRLAHYAKRMQYQPILLSHVVINDASQTANEHKNKQTVYDKFYAGYRVYLLMSDYSSSEAKQYLYTVSKLYIVQGIKYFNAINVSPKEKSEVLKRYIPNDKNFGTFCMLIRNNSFIYSVFSNMASPLFCFALRMKRKYKRR